MFIHDFDLAFCVKTEHDAEHVTSSELLNAVRARIEELQEDDQILEACGFPFNTMEDT